MIPYSSQLSREFTQYKLKHVARFESVYSIRLYELLVQWSSIGEREIEVEWLKRQFQVAEKYERVVDLKKRVIDPAVAEIKRPLAMKSFLFSDRPHLAAMDRT